MYKCLECGHIFEHGEEARWTEMHGEHMTGCPVCKCAYEETIPCRVCGSAHLDDELYSGICRECLIEQATPQNVLEYVSEEHIEIDFYSYFYRSEMTVISPELRRLMRGGVLQLVALDKMRKKTDTADKCEAYIVQEESELFDFSKWIKRNLRSCENV